MPVETMPVQDLNSLLLDTHLTLLGLWQEKLRRALNEDDSAHSLTDAIELHVEIAGQIGQYEKVKEEARNLLRDIMEQGGSEEVKTPVGTVTYYVPAPTVTYDKTALEALCMSDTALAEKLYPHRIVRENPPRLTVTKAK